MATPIAPRRFELLARALLCRLLGGLLCALLCTCGMAAMPAEEEEEEEDDVAHFMVDRSGEQLRVPLPANWIAVAHLRVGDVRQSDYAPDTDVPRVNDERLRIEAVPDATGTDPTEFIDLLAKDRRQECPELIASTMSSARENGYATAVRLFDCPRAPGKGPPLLMLKVIRGERWLYVVARSSTRADTRREQQAHERTRVADWAQFMRKLSLCHALRPDHACPRASGP